MDILASARARVLIGITVFAILSGLTADAHAAQIVADFGTTAMWDPASSGPFVSTALWNTVEKRVQAAISADGITAGSEIVFGDGSDGAFDNGPVQTGITIFGSEIRIDTDLKKIYNFSSFNLSNGKTIAVKGSNPLTIRVLGASTIAGTISADGVAGTSNSTPGPAPGGVGVGGGANGGNAGFGVTGSETASVGGSPIGGTVAFGGSLGVNDSSFGNDNGGGGGCLGSSGTGTNALPGSGNAPGAAGLCPAGVSNSRDKIAIGFESLFTGGAGGGGGSGYTNVTLPTSGSGGGAGGGAIHFVSLGKISFGSSPLLGTITAQGGKGGTNSNGPDATNCGGAGGGGSGGSIWIQTPKTVADAANPGNLDISKGAGGTDFDGAVATCGGFANGGDGSSGILRIDAAAKNVTGSAPAAALVPAPLPGKTYVLRSKAFDTGTSTTSYKTPTETVDTTSSGCGTGGFGMNAGALDVAYQGSNDAVNFSGDVPKEQITILNGFRYIRFKVTVNTGANGSAPCLTGLSIAYGSTHFDVKGGLACGTVGRADRASKNLRDSKNALDMAWLAIAALATQIYARHRRQRRFASAPLLHLD